MSAVLDGKTIFTNKTYDVICRKCANLGTSSDYHEAEVTAYEHARDHIDHRTEVARQWWPDGSVDRNVKIFCFIECECGVSYDIYADDDCPLCGEDWK